MKNIYFPEEDITENDLFFILQHDRASGKTH